MAEKYISVRGETVTEKIIEKSRFITTSKHIESEEEARAFIAEISSKFKDATHNCYAYICDMTGNHLRFSDDGEPQGTAGMPMLEVLKNNVLRQTAVVVTRYFGGIKLGAGGLVRAYAGAVAENIAAAEKVSYEMCSEKEYGVDYSSVDAALRFLSAFGAEILNCEYSDRVIFTAAVKKKEEERFDKEFTDSLNGRLSVNKIRECFYPFKI